MHIVRLTAALGALSLSSLALADTHFECGTVACSAFGNQQVTGIDDLVVDGDHFNVTFSATQDTTFLFSPFAATSGEPSTGIDAANAIDAFYVTQQGPIPQDDGPAMPIITAYELTSTPGVVDLDIAHPFFGLPGAAPEAIYGVSSSFLCGIQCTTWTRIAAPEISPVSASAGLTLLLGCLVVLRGRRPMLKNSED
jgi:hypothetical protein